MSAYAATVRPVLDPPHPSSLPRAEQLELSGANAWAYGVSTRLLADPGRWDLFNLVQGGMEWLDEYWGEIEDKYVDNTNTEEEIDFVDLVKTPAKLKSTNKTAKTAAANAEKLARINALHFAKVDPGSSSALLSSATAQTVHAQPERNPFNPHELGDDHVITHEPPTPAPTTQQTRPPARAHQAQPLPGSSLVHTAMAAPLPQQERRFGPRPLPAPPGGIRSRQPSNASNMSSILPSLPPLGSLPTLPCTSTQVPFPTTHTASIASPPSSQRANVTKRPQVPESEPSIGMELDVPLNDMTSGPFFPTGASRKPSFASLPDPSPLRKSTKLVVAEKERSRERVNSTTSGSGGAAKAVRGSSGWFKNVARTPTSNGLTSMEKLALRKEDTDEATAANTAANAATGLATLPSSSTVTPNLTVVPASTGVKRKSDLISASPRRMKATTTSGTSKEGRKVQKKVEGDRPGKLFGLDDDPMAALAKPASSSSDKMPVSGLISKKRDDSVPKEKNGIVNRSMDGDDTAERLLKLRKTLSRVIPEGEKKTDELEPRSRVNSGATMEGRPESRPDSTAEGSRPRSRSERPESRSTDRTTYKTASELSRADDDAHSRDDDRDRASHATSDRTRVGSGRLSIRDLEPVKGQNEHAKEGKDRSGKKKAFSERHEELKKGIEQRKEIFKHQPSAQPPNTIPSSNTFGSTIFTNVNLTTSTTPPGSPLPTTKPEKLAKVPTKPDAVKVEQAEKEKKPIFKPPPVKGIFSAPPPKFQPSRPVPVSKAYPESQTTVESQSTEADSLLSGRSKTRDSVETQPTEYSQPPQSQRKKEEETRFTWREHEDGVTAGWMSKGGDTIGEKSARPPEEEEDEVLRDEWSGDEDNVTNHRWAAIRAGVEAEEADAKMEEAPEVGYREDEGVEDEDEVPELPQSVKKAEPGGIFAQVGAMASKAVGGFGLKSLRMAAQAAEKEKAEKEKKEAIQKEREAKRLAAAQKKAEEETKRREREEAERKKKFEEDRKKKEKEKEALNRSAKVVKPQQMPPSGEKKPELKKAPSKLALGTSSSKVPTPLTSKRAPTSTQTQSTIKLIGSSKEASASTPSLLPIPPSSNTNSTLTSILGAPAKQPGAKVTFKPSTAIPKLPPSAANMMGAKAAEMKASNVISEQRLSEGGIDENADLPDIKSEYSDSEDESRSRTYNPPGWAQSPDLRVALENMRTVNPDTIFGAMPALHMEEIFPGGRRKSRFRNRTSSANWAGTDGVTREEMEEYARRMGFED